MNTSVPVRNDGSAVINYSFEDYSVEVNLNTLSSYPNYSVNSHWHDDLELTIVLSGHMLCNVNGTIVKLEAGQGIFINSRCFHYGFSVDRSECTYLSVVIHPMLLCSSPLLEHTFVNPFISAKAPAYVFLHENIPWAAEIQRLAISIHEHRESSSAALWIQSCIFQIWNLLFENVFQNQIAPPANRKKDQKLIALKSMVTYIKENYQEKITLDDIAKIGCMSKSGCLSIFKRYLNESPIDFLIDYRLKIGAKLLSETSLSVTAIAYQVGFSSTSYFSSRFHLQYDCTPQEYRKKTSDTSLGN